MFLKETTSGAVCRLTGRACYQRATKRVLSVKKSCGSPIAGSNVEKRCASTVAPCSLQGGETVSGDEKSLSNRLRKRKERRANCSNLTSTVLCCDFCGSRPADLESASQRWKLAKAGATSGPTRTETPELINQGMFIARAYGATKLKTTQIPIGQRLL